MRIERLESSNGVSTAAHEPKTQSVAEAVDAFTEAGDADDVAEAYAEAVEVGATSKVMKNSTSEPKIVDKRKFRMTVE